MPVLRSDGDGGTFVALCRRNIKNRPPALANDPRADPKRNGRLCESGSLDALDPFLPLWLFAEPPFFQSFARHFFASCLWGKKRGQRDAHLFPSLLVTRLEIVSFCPHWFQKKFRPVFLADSQKMMNRGDMCPKAPQQPRTRLFLMTSLLVTSRKPP